jgi:hypothetical protein
MHKYAKVILAFLVAASGIAGGLKLAMYADADDSPGGMMIGVAIMFGSLALGLWIVLRGTGKSAESGG